MSEQASPAAVQCFDEPNFTPTPNRFFDTVMLDITTMSEMKVTLALIRQTFGWQRQDDQVHMTLSDLGEATGLGRSTVQDGVERALGRGYVYRVKVGLQEYAYGIRVGKEEPERSVKRYRPTAEPSGPPDSTVRPTGQLNTKPSGPPDGTVRPTGRSGASPYSEKKKHTPLPPEGGSGARRSRGGKTLPTLPADAPKATVTQCPELADFLDDGRYAWASAAHGLTRAQVDRISEKWRRKRRSRGDYLADWLPDWQNYVETFAENHADELAQERRAAAPAAPDRPALTLEEMQEASRRMREAARRRRGDIVPAG